MTRVTNNPQIDAEDNPVESVWVVWKRPAAETIWVWHAEVRPIGMAGIDEWGARTHLCVPIGAHISTPQKGGNTS